MKRKIAACLLSISLLSLSPLASFADTVDVQGYDVTVDDDGDSVEYVEYAEYSKNGSNKTSIYAVVASNYRVTIPKVIVLKGDGAIAEYIVDVDGDISGDEKIVVTPEENFEMYSVNKAPITATVQQNHTAFRTEKYKNLVDKEINFVDETDFVQDTTGVVFANGATAGKWSGSFDFNISLVKDTVGGGN